MYQNQVNYSLILKDNFKLETLVMSFTSIKRHLISKIRFQNECSAHLTLWLLLLSVLSDRIVASHLLSNFTAQHSHVHPLINLIYRHLSPYIKTDGTTYYCESESETFEDIILKFSNLAKFENGSLAAALVNTGELDLHSAEHVEATTRAYLLRFSNCGDADSLITEIVSLLTRFNTLLIFSTQQVNLERFTLSFDNEGALENKRALGARTF